MEHDLNLFRTGKDCMNGEGNQVVAKRSKEN